MGIRLSSIEPNPRQPRQDFDIAALEELAQSIRESRYDDLIAARMENMEIRGDLDKLQRFTAEQLG